MDVKVRILGSGTSTGVPMLGCRCETCTSRDPKDYRDRASILLSDDDKNIVVDTTPDFRHQMLQADVSSIEAVLLTHHHADHIHGFDDLRQFSLKSGMPIPVYAQPGTIEWVGEHFKYIWHAPQQGGGLPKVELKAVNEVFSAAGIRFRPIPVKHGVMDVYGYRSGNFAYISDVSHIPSASKELLRGVDVLVIDAVRYQAHATHFHVEAAVAVANELGIKQTYLTHLSHHFLHRRLADELPEGIHPAYDGLTITINAEDA